MRIESSVTAISWIPSEAIEGAAKLSYALGVRQYDEPPPDRLRDDDLELLRDADRFRQANHLSAWIEVEDGRIVDHGQDGGGLFAPTVFHVGMKVTVPAVAFEVLRSSKPREDAVRFVQTVGGRAGSASPRRVSGKPYFRIDAATAWTTLALTIGANGTWYHELVGASPFPRHWIYDRAGELVEKSGTIDFEKWHRDAHGQHTPWGDENSEAFVTAAESALEREITRELIGDKMAWERRKLEPGDNLLEQGDAGTDLYVLLDGVVAVVVDGDEIAEIGPGAILGELASLGSGKRTATLSARTACRVAVVPEDLIDPEEMEDLAATRGT